MRGRVVVIDVYRATDPSNIAVYGTLMDQFQDSVWNSLPNVNCTYVLCWFFPAFPVEIVAVQFSRLDACGISWKFIVCSIHLMNLLFIFLYSSSAVSRRIAVNPSNGIRPFGSELLWNIKMSRLIDCVSEYCKASRYFILRAREMACWHHKVTVVIRDEREYIFQSYSLPFPTANSHSQSQV